MKCLHCQKHNPDIAVYCQHCGSYLPSEVFSDIRDILVSFITAVCLTAFFYSVFPIPVTEHPYLLALFSGHVSEAIVGLSAWAVCMVLFKYRRYRVQRKGYRTFRVRDINNLLAQGVVIQNVDDQLIDLGNLLKQKGLKRFQNTIIFRRIRRLFYYLKAVPKKEEINRILEYQAQIDFNRMENSYTLLNVLIWAIPVLGFIGTVFGIGEAIGEFSTFIRSVETTALSSQIRSALGGVTQGLSVAFNTTFLALICVIPIMTLTSFMRRADEELLLHVEEYCLEEVLPYLELATDMQAGNINLEAQLQKMAHFSDRWIQQLKPLVSNTVESTEGLQYQVKGLQDIVHSLSDTLLQSKQITKTPTSES